MEHKSHHVLGASYTFVVIVAPLSAARRGSRRVTGSRRQLRFANKCIIISAPLVLRDERDSNRLGLFVARAPSPKSQQGLKAAHLRCSRSGRRSLILVRFRQRRRRTNSVGRRSYLRADSTCCRVGRPELIYGPSSALSRLNCRLSVAMRTLVGQLKSIIKTGRRKA